MEAKRRQQVAHVSHHSSGDTRQSGAICHLLNDQLIIINVPQWSKVRDYLRHLADAHRLLVSNDEIKSLFNHPPGCHGEHISLFIHPSIPLSKTGNFFKVGVWSSLRFQRGKEVRLISASSLPWSPLPDSVKQLDRGEWFTYKAYTAAHLMRFVCMTGGKWGRFIPSEQQFNGEVLTSLHPGPNVLSYGVVWSCVIFVLGGKWMFSSPSEVLFYSSLSLQDPTDSI